MAQLKDSLITGDLRVTGTIYGDVPLDDLVDAADLKAIEALSGSGIPVRTGENTWTMNASVAPSAHAHGNLTSDGKVGTDANKAIYTGTGGAIQARTLPVEAGGTGQTSITNIKAGKDGDGNTITSTYVKKAGDTMTGALTIKKQTANTNTYADTNPKIIFQNSDASQNASLTYTDYDSVEAPVSLTLNGNQGNEYFIAPNVKALRAIKQLITGTGTAASDKGEGVSPRYFPARWTFNTGKNAANGEIFTIKTPVAGHSYGVFMSVDNGATYYPVVNQGTSRVTTHYPNGYMFSVIFDSAGSAADMYALNGADSRATVSGGVFRVLNYYDSGNTNTLLRTYSSATNIDVPLIGQNSAASTTATWSTYTGTYKDWYGAIPNDDTKRAKINLSTGAVTVASLASTSTTDATNSTTAPLKTAGGLAVAKKAWIGSSLGASSTSNNSSQLIISSSDTGAGGNVSLELWRGTNASWQLSNEGGDFHIRTNYTTAKQSTYSVDAVKIAYNTGTITLKSALTVANGGTGATSFTANSVIMSNTTTTGALTTRAVTNNTTATAAVNNNTNIITQNTLYYATASINNARQTSSVSVYAPASAGTANQILASAGGTSAPTWKDPSNLGILHKGSNTLTSGYLLAADGTDGKVKSVEITSTAIDSLTVAYQSSTETLQFQISAGQTVVTAIGDIQTLVNGNGVSY